MQDAGWTKAGSGQQIQRTPSGRISARAMAALLLVTAAFRAEAADNLVRVYPTAVVTSDQVILSDIAALSGEGTQLAGTWAITEAPKPGQEITIDQSALQKALVRRGINASQWLFRGSSRCRISRPLAARSATQPSATDGDEGTPARSSRRGSRLSHGAVTTAPENYADLVQPQVTEPDPNTLEGAIYQHLLSRLSRFGGRPSMQVSPAIRKLLALSRPAYEFSLTDRSDRSIGLVPLEVAIYRDGKLDQVQSILVQVSLLKQVVVAAGPINRGQTIGASDVVLREQTFDRTDALGMDNLNAVVGQRAVRFVSKDDMLTGKDIEPLPLVQRNDVVAVTARIGNITISSSAKALAAATYGETVELRNEVSKQTFVGIVTGPKTAELVLGGTTPPKTVSMAGGNQ
jgi:flagella basal body P-ring formation protein FlgA